MLRKRILLVLLKGKFEGRNQGNCTSPFLLKGKSEGGKKGDHIPQFLLKGNYEGGNQGDCTSSGSSQGKF